MLRQPGSGVAVADSQHMTTVTVTATIDTYWGEKGTAKHSKGATLPLVCTWLCSQCVLMLHLHSFKGYCVAVCCALQTLQQRAAAAAVGRWRSLC